MRTEEEMILEMSKHGYWYDEISSYASWRVFDYAGGRLSFDSWEDVNDYLNNVIWDDMA